MLSGYIAAIVFLFCLTGGIYCFGYAARRTNAFWVAQLEVIAGFLIVTIILLTTEKISVRNLVMKPGMQQWCWLGMAGITGYIGGNYFTLLNLRAMGEKGNSLLSPVITAVASLAGVLVFKEKINGAGITGIIICLAAVSFFLLNKNSTPAKPIVRISNKKAIVSAAGVVCCVTLTIIFSVKGAAGSALSIYHDIWLRLLVAFIFASILNILKRPDEQTTVTDKNTRLYAVIITGVVLQTVAAAYLWFYATLAIGIASFQTIVALLPFLIYFIDSVVLSKPVSARYFLLTAFFAFLGVCLLVWQNEISQMF